MSKEVSVRVGPGFGMLLTLLFVGLKLTHHIDWPWVWVLSPLWIGLAACVAIFLVAFIGIAAYEGIRSITCVRRQR